MLTLVRLLLALMSLLVQQALTEDGSKVTISRHYQGDMFFGHGSSCEDSYCDGGGGRSAKTIRRGSCQCQCSGKTPVFRDDLQLCVDDIEECVLADYVSGMTTEKIPFVFLPLKGQLIYPEAEIALADVRSEGQTLLAPVCVVSKAHFLTPKGWVPIENGSSSEPPFSLYREDTKTYLQWLGDGALRVNLDGRLILVRLLCKDTANARIGVFSPCIGFRIAGSPGAAEITFDGGLLDVSPSVAGSVLPQGNYVAIGIASGVLGLLYVLGVAGFLVYRRRRKAAASRKAKLDSISSPIMEDGKLKANPLLLQSPAIGGLKRVDSKLGPKSLVDRNEAMALFQDAARRHVSPTGLHSPDFSHLSYPFSAGLLPGQVPSMEDDLLDAHLFQAGFDPALLTKEDRDLILGQSYMDQNTFESQSPEFLARVRSAIDSARLKMSSRKFFPSLFDIPEEQRDYGSVSKASQVSRKSSFKAMLQAKSEPKPTPLQPSSDSGANGDTSDSSQTKSTTDGSAQPIYVSRRKKPGKDTTYGTIKKNVTSTLEKVKQTFTKEESKFDEIKSDESQAPMPVYTNPSIESIYGSLMRESHREAPSQEKDEPDNGKTTFGEVNKQPLYDRLKISEKQSEEKVMKPAERVNDVIKASSSVQTEAAQVKPVMVEKATYTTMTIIRANSKAEKRSKVNEKSAKNGSVDDILSDAESKIPKVSSDSEPESAVKHLQKKIWFEPDSLDRPRRAFETPQKTFVKNSKPKPDRYEMRKIHKAKVETARKLESPEALECDSSASTCKSVKSLSRVLPGGDEMEVGNGLFNMATGASTLKRSGKKKEEDKPETSKPPMYKTNSGDMSDVSTTSRQEVWDLAGDSNWFAKPNEKTYDFEQEEEYSSLESARKPMPRSQIQKPTKLEDSKSEYSCSDDYGFEPDTLEKHKAPHSRRQRFMDSLERSEMPGGTLKQRASLKGPARAVSRIESSPRNKEVRKSVERDNPRIPAKTAMTSTLEKAHSKSLPSFERMVDESPALPMKSLRQIFESEDSITQSPAPPRPSKSIDIQRLNEEIGKQNEVRNPAEQKRTTTEPPPKLPPRTGGVLPPNLPPKLMYRRSASLDELMDYEPIGSVHSGISAYDDAKSTTSSVHDILMRIEEFEREEAMLRQNHIMDEEGRITESGISKGMEIALQIRAKMLENKNTKSSIKIKLRKFLEKMEDTFSENDGSPSKKGGKTKSFSLTDTMKSGISQVSLASTVESSGDYDSQKRALAEQSSIHSDTDWHFSANSTPQNGRRTSDNSDEASVHSDRSGNESSCSFDTLKTRKSYPMKPVGDYGFFVNNIYSCDTAKKKTMSSVDSGVFSTGQVDGRTSGLK